jgi:hypothetical protein
MIYTSFFFYPKWKKTRTEATISWDVSGYYMYLPAIFIYKDIKKCNFKENILTKYYPTPDFQQAMYHEKSGSYVMKYASGQAITMMPFFFMAHLYCKLNPTYPADGFSFPYQFFIGFGMLFYAFVGIFILRLILLHFFKDWTVAILLLCLVVGTNYLNYSAIDQAMTHNVLFTIYCSIIFFTIKFDFKPTYFYALILGLFIGLATLIRPTDIITALIPILWNINAPKEIVNKFKFIIVHFSKFFLIGFFALAIFSIQLFYWKYVTNEWFVYSYDKQGFSWLHPHVFNYTISYKCGWLRYCPMMFLPFLGMLFYLKYGVHKMAIILISFINLYIVTAWDIWDYGGTAGRAMVQTYPILAFPFCVLIEYLLSKKWTTIILFIPIFIFGYLNIWWTYHSHVGNIQMSDLTKEYYWRVLGRWNEDDEDKKLLDNKQTFNGVPQYPIVLYSNNFNEDTSINVINIGDNKQIRINKEIQSSSDYVIENSSHFKKWIRVSADFHCINKEWDIWKQAQFILKFTKQNIEIQNNVIKVHRFIADGETKNIYLDALNPTNKWDTLSIVFWNAESDKELLIDNLEVKSFND